MGSHGRAGEVEGAEGENDQLSAHPQETSGLPWLPLAWELDIFGNSSGRGPRWLIEHS